MMSDLEIMSDLEHLRKLAAWYREFAERTGNPINWEMRLSTAEGRSDRGSSACSACFQPKSENANFAACRSPRVKEDRGSFFATRETLRWRLPQYGSSHCRLQTIEALNGEFDDAKAGIHIGLLPAIRPRAVGCKRPSP
jgi:hypothetical protein